MAKSKAMTTTKHKLTAAQVEKDCPARLQQIGKEIAARLAKADKQTELARNHLIAIDELLAEAKELCDGGGFNKFRELFCPQLGKSQAYALLAIAAGKKRWRNTAPRSANASEGRERTKMPRRRIPGQSRKRQRRYRRGRLLPPRRRPMLRASCRTNAGSGEASARCHAKG
jgi:hypothetical protein